MRAGQRQYPLNRLHTARTGKGIGIAGIDHQPAGLAAGQCLAAPFHLGRRAFALGQDTGDGCAVCQLDKGQVTAVPVLVLRTRDAAGYTMNIWQLC